MDARIVLWGMQRIDSVCRLYAETQDAKQHESGTLLLHKKERK